MTLEELLLYRGEKLGEGREKECFLYKKDVNICLKISKNNSKKHVLKEALYLTYLEKHYKNCSFIPRFFGYALSADKTKIGFLQECFLPKSQGGKYDIVETVGNCLRKGIKRKEEIQQDLLRIKNFMLKHNIVNCDTCEGNILYLNSAGEQRYVIIDGYGCSELIPASTCIAFLGRRRTKRTWDHLETWLKNFS